MITFDLDHYGSVLSNHQVMDTHVDINGRQFVLKVGSWFAGTSGPPWVVTTVALHIPTWSPDYCFEAEALLSTSPQWGGSGVQCPSADHIWNPIDLQWYLPAVELDALKLNQWQAIKKARALAEHGGFVWDGSRFDSDFVSQQRINGAVTLAQINPSFLTTWVLQDNSTRNLDAQDMQQVGLALGVHVQQQFARAQSLRGVLDAAVSAQEVVTVVF